MTPELNSSLRVRPQIFSLPVAWIGCTDSAFRPAVGVSKPPEATEACAAGSESSLDCGVWYMLGRTKPTPQEVSMRKLLWVVCVVFVFAVGVQAQGKVASQWKCGKATVEHSIDVGDQPGHAYVVNQTKCSATKTCPSAAPAGPLAPSSPK